MFLSPRRQWESYDDPFASRSRHIQLKFTSHPNEGRPPQRTREAEPTSRNPVKSKAHSTSRLGGLRERTRSCGSTACCPSIPAGLAARNALLSAPRARHMPRLPSRSGRRRTGRGAAATGIRPAADAGAGDRAPADRAPLRVWCDGLPEHARLCQRTGVPPAADHRDRPVSVWGQFLSKKRTAQALAELFGTPVSEGTVAAMSRTRRRRAD